MGKPVVTRIGFLVALLLSAGVGALKAKEPYEVGWFLWDPYVVEVREGGIYRLSGLNVELANAVFERIGLDVEWNEVDWEQYMERMARGEADLAVGASKTREREEFAWYSDPFFDESIVLMSHEGSLLHRKGDSPEGLLARVESDGLRVGYVAGYYYGELVAEFLQNLPPSRKVPSLNDSESLERFLEGKSDVLIADRLVATTIAWRADVLEKIEIHPTVLNQSDLHVIFGKNSFEESVRDRFNETLAEMKRDGTIQDITRRYMLPVLLEITLHTDWFVWIGVIGVFAFATSGVLLARREGYDIFGAFVLASLPALGGGVVRDVLTDRHPVLLFRSNLQVYIFIVIGVVIGAAIFYRLCDYWKRRRPSPRVESEGPYRKVPMRLVGICDALGLSAFIVTGVLIALEQQCEPLWLWGPLIAALTGSGGGILRDVVRADAENPMIKGEFYPEIAVVWGLLFSVFLEWQATRLQLVEIGVAVIVTIVGAFATRMVVIHYGIRSPLLSPGTKPTPQTSSR